MDKSEKFWDNLANKFDERAKHFEQTHIRMVENTKKYLTGSDIVLDFGCATGTVAIELADRVKEVHGIDISSKMVDAARRKAADHNIQNSDFAQSTIFDEKLKEGSFNVILAFNILHLFKEDTEKVVQRIHELLKPGGLCISTTACMGEKETFFDNLTYILMKIAVLIMKIGGISDIRFLKNSELEGLITNKNFQIVYTESLAHNPTNYFIVAKKSG